MQQFTGGLEIATRGRGLYEITAQVSDWVRERAMRTGLLTVWVRHTSASLTVQENADPDVLRDLDDFFARLAPEDEAAYSTRAAWRWEPGRVLTCSSTAGSRTGSYR